MAIEGFLVFPTDGMDSLKIAMLYDLAYPFTIGGGERRYAVFGRELRKRGHIVDFITKKFWPGPCWTELNGDVFCGISGRDENYSNSEQRSLRSVLKYSLGVFRFVLRSHYDVYDFCNIPILPALAGALAATITRKKYCITWLEVTDDNWHNLASRPLSFLGRILERLLIALSSNAIVISEFTLRRFLAFGGKGNYEVIGYGLEQEENTFESHDQMMLLFVGRLQSHKRVDLLVDALGLLSAPSEVGIHLIIIGRGECEKDLHERVEKLNLNCRVTFNQKVSEAELSQIAAKARLLLLPSEREGLGLVALEALSRGTPVLTVESDFNATKELIQNGVNGVVVHPSPTAIAEGILTILREPAFFWHNRTKDSVKKYEMSVQADRLERFYWKISRRSGPHC